MIIQNIRNFPSKSQQSYILGSLCFFAFSLFLLTPSFNVVAQQTEMFQDAERKRVNIARIDSEPNIDGVLDEAFWQQATVLTDMHQFQPVDHAEPSERSEFYLAYNERFLYVGARLYDSDPSGINARQLVQGQNMQFDDAFEFILDTFNNGRTGYHFQVNPNGIRREGVYDQPNNLNRDWTGIWLVESRIDDEGWTAEVAIPFNTLNFDPDTEEWGFTIARTIARKREELAWSSFNRNINPTTTGLITGIRDIRQGVGLDIIPSIAMANSEDHLVGTKDDRVDPSLNVFYKITPNLTGAVTLNTDFSATEVDNRQVNLSRFSLFFPEKRDFFLQDVDIFSFGGLGGGGSYNNNQNGIPFYSRRLGLSRSGQAVDIDAGVKLTGRVGQWNVGTLAVQQGDFDGLDGQSLFVGRAAVNVLSESSVGAIVTQGDPNSEIDNTLAGMDFRYQNTRFSDRYTMSGNAWYQQSDTDGLTGDDKAYGMRINFDTQSNGLGGNAGYSYIGEDFNPALGFANQRGIESYSLMGRYRYNFIGHSLLRTYNLFSRFTQDRNLATGDLVSENIFGRILNLNTHRGDQFGIGFSRNREGLDQNFEIRPGIVIPAGKYTFTSLNAQLQFANQRNFAPSIQVNIGEFYEGDRTQYSVGVQWRPDEHLFMNFRYNYQDIELPQGEFVVRVASANVNYAFNSKWSWVNLVQYDNVSSSVGLNSRLRWNPQAGENLFVVINYGFDSEGTFDRLSREKSEIALKYTKTFRF
ncbi:MAG: DUF5916 domain-containing protein [Pseudomonadales bacterium]